MAQFGTMIITEKGHALMAKKLMDEGKGTFTAIRTSSFDYAGINLETLSELQEIQQSAEVRTVAKINDKTVMVTTILTNEGLTEGYHLTSIGLYAEDPDEGEILYAVATAKHPDYIPAFNNFSISEVTFNLYVSVSNADSVTIDVDLTSYATVRELKDLEDRINKLLQKGMGPKIYVAEDKPEVLHAGDWWYKEVNSAGVETVLLETSQFDENRPYSVKTNNTIETVESLEENPYVVEIE